MNREDRMKEFGRRLDRFMSELGVTGAWIDDRTRISHTEITRARRGVFMPTREHARKIAEALEQSFYAFDDLYLPDDYEDEEWRPLARYPEYYGSTKGRILNPNTGRLMKTERCPNGRSKVQLYINGKSRTLRVDDLIDETFG